MRNGVYLVSNHILATFRFSIIQSSTRPRKTSHGTSGRFCKTFAKKMADDVQVLWETDNGSAQSEKLQKHYQDRLWSWGEPLYPSCFFNKTFLFSACFWVIRDEGMRSGGGRETRRRRRETTKHLVSVKLIDLLPLACLFYICFNIWSFVSPFDKLKLVVAKKKKV